MKKRYMVLLMGVGLVAVIVGASLFGYGMWYDAAHYVSTDDAQVVARQVQVGSVNAGRIVAMNVDIGTPVMEGQVIATVDIPTGISRSDITGTTKIGFRPVQDQLAEVVAPRSGVISARWANEGDTMPAGQPIVTLMDLRQVWVEANIEEGKIENVRPGQYVEVEVDYLEHKLVGWVETVSPVTAVSSSLLQELSTPSGAGRVGQFVPIKITLDEDRFSLIPGSTAKIQIWVD